MKELAQDYKVELEFEPRLARLRAMRVKQRKNCCPILPPFVPPLSSSFSFPGKCESTRGIWLVLILVVLRL